MVGESKLPFLFAFLLFLPAFSRVYKVQRDRLWKDDKVEEIPLEERAVSRIEYTFLSLGWHHAVRRSTSQLILHQFV